MESFDWTGQQHGPKPSIKNLCSRKLRRINKNNPRSLSRNCIFSWQQERGHSKSTLKQLTANLYYSRDTITAKKLNCSANVRNLLKFLNTNFYLFQDILALEELNRQLFMEIHDMQNMRERIEWSKTWQGKYFNFLGYFFSLYCLWKIFISTVNNFCDASSVNRKSNDWLEIRTHLHLHWCW